MKARASGLKPWQEELSQSVVTASRLREYIDVDLKLLEKVLARYPMRITPYFLSLIKEKHDPIWKQAIPDPAELSDRLHDPDPLSEEDQSPVPSIIHRYPDRVIFLVSNQCAVYCRHCMRKRRVGDRNLHFSAGSGELEKGLDYIGSHNTIRDVILSGGDPLLLKTDRINRILRELSLIDHIEILRIHTRVPCTLPARITPNLAGVLKRYHPLYINIHFNHPDEITDEARKACILLADAGIPLGCQTVLLKGVNDCPEILACLMKKLVRIRVKPYYLHHPDPVLGTAHFRSSMETGLRIMKKLQGNLSGICIPRYMIDLPGGHGKVPMLPEYIKDVQNSRALVESYTGDMCRYRFR